VLTAIVTVLPGVGWTRRAVFGLNVVGTVAHEAGHAAAGIVTGGGVITIRVHTPHSGVTHYWHHSRISEVVVKSAGYATPPRSSRRRTSRPPACVSARDGPGPAGRPHHHRHVACPVNSET